MKKAAVLFPGVRYSCDTPLLYYAGKVFAQRGYEVFQLNYGKQMQSADDLEQGVRKVRDSVLAQLNDMELSGCSDVVFVSKSVGTVLAGWTASRLAFPVRHIYLTPLEQTLPFIDSETDAVVGAGDDPYLPEERLVPYCQERHIPLTVYPHTGHRLEDKEDIHRTLEILQEIVRLYETF